MCLRPTHEDFGLSSSDQDLSYHSELRHFEKVSTHKCCHPLCQIWTRRVSRLVASCDPANACRVAANAETLCAGRTFREHRMAALLIVCLCLMALFGTGTLLKATPIAGHLALAALL